MNLLLNVLVFNVWLPKWEKEKNEGKEEHQLLKSSGSHFSWRERGLQQWGGVITMAASLSATPWSAAAIRIQSPNIWRTESLLLTLVPVSCMQAAPWTHKHLSVKGWGWGMSSCYYAKSQKWPKITIIDCQLFPWKSQAFIRPQHYKIVTSDRFCQCDCSLVGGQIPVVFFFSPTIFSESFPHAKFSCWQCKSEAQISLWLCIYR